MVGRVALLFHLLGFAAFVGAAIAQSRLLAASRAAGLAPDARDAFERLAATIVTKLELPALLVSIASGVALLVLFPAWLHAAWLHAKLGCVVGLAVLSHLEMFNARRIVRARERGPGGEADVEDRKRRHALYGTAEVLLVAAVVALAVLKPGT